MYNQLSRYQLQNSIIKFPVVNMALAKEIYNFVSIKHHRSSSRAGVLKLWFANPLGVHETFQGVRGRLPFCTYVDRLCNLSYNNLKCVTYLHFKNHLNVIGIEKFRCRLFTQNKLEIRQWKSIAWQQTSCIQVYLAHIISFQL